MEVRYVVYLLYSVIGIAGNAYSFYQNGSFFIIGVSLLSGIIVIGSAEKFHRRFDYPLFFVRNELNYWGGAFGGVSVAVFYIIGFVSLGSVGYPEIFSFMYLIMSGFMSLLILYTGTILRDIELGYVKDPSS